MVNINELAVLPNDFYGKHNLAKKMLNDAFFEAIKSDYFKRQLYNLEGNKELNSTHDKLAYFERVNDVYLKYVDLVNDKYCYGDTSDFYQFEKPILKPDWFKKQIIDWHIYKSLLHDLNYELKGFKSKRMKKLITPSIHIKVKIKHGNNTK